MHPLDAEEASIVKAYTDFSSALLQPECAMLVQGMRSFFRNLPASTMEEMATSLKIYLEKTCESLKSHVAWKGHSSSSSMDDYLVRRSLDSFVYGHCKPILDSLQWDGLFQMTEHEWKERLLQLQFVQPAHLEIECLIQKEGSNTAVDLDEILKAPKEALLSVDQYYSPFEKLQRILKMYQGVNAALSTALNYQQQQQSGEVGRQERKLPSADDVLPTIILTVLRAQPDRIFRNLQLVEAFCPPEYLRGEAGYAYTNLYGAVQFLQDMDLEHPSSLAISPEDFRKGLEECKASTRKRISAMTESSASNLLLLPEQQQLVAKTVDLSVQDVRMARLRGEVVDLEWALQWQQQQQQHHSSSFKGQSTGMKSTAEDDEDQLYEDVAEVALPVGFSRSYAFLTSRPEDIRLADLPNLLAEYRMLAHTTERLLGERTARIQSKKRQQKSQRKQLLHDRMMLQADDDAAALGVGTTTITRERVNTS
jgi:Vacuolar sorting protein 9 (VPS9) domain